MSDSDSEFISVIRRNKMVRQKTNTKTNTKTCYNLSYPELEAIVKLNLLAYKKEIVGAYIYGSRARGTNRPNSDADIIVFWRHEYDQEFLKSIKTSIEEALGFKIDFVACVVKKNWVEHPDLRDEAYFENVIIDAKSIIGTESIRHLIDHSMKLPKLS